MALRLLLLVQQLLSVAIITLPVAVGAAGGCSSVDGACICQDGLGNEWDVSELTAGSAGAAARQWPHSLGPLA